MMAGCEAYGSSLTRIRQHAPAKSGGNLMNIDSAWKPPTVAFRPTLAERGIRGRLAGLAGLSRHILRSRRVPDTGFNRTTTGLEGNDTNFSEFRVQSGEKSSRRERRGEKEEA